MFRELGEELVEMKRFWIKTDNDGNVVFADPIKEGTVKKGGINKPPTTPRPELPKGQGGKLVESRCDICGAWGTRTSAPVKVDLPRVCRNCGADLRRSNG